jgi:hypothetical protein
MSNEANEIPRRHSGLVAYVELLQLASVISIGAMLLWPLARLRDAAPPDYAAWAWPLFLLAALAGAIVPFFVKPAEDVRRHEGEYVWDARRVVTLRQVLKSRDAEDIVSALESAPVKAGSAAELHNVLSDAVGEERAAEFLPLLYRYLRATPREARIPISEKHQSNTSSEAQRQASNDPAGGSGLVGERAIKQ